MIQTSRRLPSCHAASIQVRKKAWFYKSTEHLCCIPHGSSEPPQPPTSICRTKPYVLRSHASGRRINSTTAARKVRASTKTTRTTSLRMSRRPCAWQAPCRRRAASRRRLCWCTLGTATSPATESIQGNILFFLAISESVRTQNWQGRSCPHWRKLSITECINDCHSLEPHDINVSQP